MRVSQAMTSDVKVISPDRTIREAAELMAELDSGALPVGENDRLVGMVTDRDIAIRGIAAGLKPTAKIREVMTPQVKYCFDDDEVDDVARNMGDVQVRRLPVVNRNKRLVGIISLGDVALTEGPAAAGPAICGISEKTAAQAA
jgi:CBS domain-containing protein